MEQYVDAGIDISMSFSDGLIPLIFCWKKEKTLPLRKKFDGKVFISRPIWHFIYFVLLMWNYSPLFCTVTWRVSKYVYLQGKGKRRRNESTQLWFCCRDVNTQSCNFADLTVFNQLFIFCLVIIYNETQINLEHF